MLQKAYLPWFGFTLAMMGVILIWYFQRREASQAPIVINDIAVTPLPTLDAKAILQGEALYKQHCAACHMSDLTGAPDWKIPLPDGSLPPPPHDDSGHTWHHPDFLLLQIIAEGGAVYEGGMPGFTNQLSPDEMRAILEFFKSRWSRESREYQWWIINTYPTPTPSP